MMTPGGMGVPSGGSEAVNRKILTAEVLVVVSKADGVFRPVEWFPQVLSNGLRGNGRWLFQLDRVNLGHAG